MTTTATSREVRLVARPRGLPTPDLFAVVETPIPTPADGEALVRNIYISVDPYMRGRMDESRSSYVPPFELGTVMTGGAIGQVVDSRTPALPVGAIVLSSNGWREYFVARADGVQRVEPAAPLSAYLGVLGMTGLTAYVGLLDIGQARAGETVFVSAAAGAVGMVVGQLARINGCRVVGSAGSDEKVSLLRELGFDAAFNYKTVDLDSALRESCPDGVDVYFDNVGGDHLRAALNAMRLHGRIAVCGMISHYNDTEPVPGPRNLFLVVGKRLTIRGFLVGDHADRTAAFREEVGRYVADGRLRYRETIVEGIEQAPEAFLSLLRGGNIGKMLVRVGPDPS